MQLVCSHLLFEALAGLAAPPPRAATAAALAALLLLPHLFVAAAAVVVWNQMGVEELLLRQAERLAASCCCAGAPTRSSTATCKLCLRAPLAPHRPPHPSTPLPARLLLCRQLPQQAHSLLQHSDLPWLPHPPLPTPSGSIGPSGAHLLLHRACRPPWPEHSPLPPDPPAAHAFRAAVGQRMCHLHSQHLHNKKHQLHISFTRQPPQAAGGERSA